MTLAPHVVSLACFPFVVMPTYLSAMAVITATITASLTQSVSEPPGNQPRSSPSFPAESAVAFVQLVPIAPLGKEADAADARLVPHGMLGVITRIAPASDA